MLVWLRSDQAQKRAQGVAEASGSEPIALFCLDKPPEPLPRAAPCQSDPVSRARRLSADLFAKAGQIDAAGVIGADSFEALARSGLPLAVFPRELGGEDLLGSSQSNRLCRVLRLVGAGDLSVARLFEGHVNAVALVSRFGSWDQLASLAAAVASGSLSAVWNAERRNGLVAERREDKWHLRGEKILASGSGLIRFPIITPLTEAGVIMLLPTLSGDECVDLSGWRPQGMRASATGTISFDGMAVPLAGQIGVPENYKQQPFFSGGSWRFCAVHLGAAERLLDLFRAHLVGRDRDGDPYQKQRVASAIVAVTTAAFFIEKAARLLATEEGTAEAIVAFSNMTRTVTERACLDVLELVHRGMGLGAFIAPEPVERVSRDLSTYLRQPVPDAAMADAAAYVLRSKAPSGDLWSSDVA